MDACIDQQTITNIINGIYNVISRASTLVSGECIDVLSPMKFKLSVRIMSYQKSHSYLVSLHMGKNVCNITYRNGGSKHYTTDITHFDFLAEKTPAWCPSVGRCYICVGNIWISRKHTSFLSISGMVVYQ